QTMGEVRRDDGKRNIFWRSARYWPAPPSVQNAHGTSGLPKMPTRRSLGWTSRLSGECRLKCLTSTGISCAGPDSANAIQVKQQATVPLYFGGVLGLKAWSATATAGARGGAIQSADVMLVVDTTASMNNADTSCSLPGSPT